MEDDFDFDYSPLEREDDYNAFEERELDNDLHSDAFEDWRDEESEFDHYDEADEYAY